MEDKRYAIVKNKKVVNIIKGKIKNAIECELTTRIGDTCIKGVFTAQPVAAIKEPTNKEKKIQAKGTTQEQLDYIVENGVDAYITEQQRINTEYPEE